MSEREREGGSEKDNGGGEKERPEQSRTEQSRANQ